jgi:ElaB/YqjD/DUF883 family membrane-anchored ribosome-binding protein
MQETQEKAREVAGQAQDKARGAAGQARGRISQEVDRRSTRAGEQVSSNASDARSVADELRKQGKDAPARYVEQAADRAERLGGYLQESDGDRILRDVEDFARRNPWAVAAGGLLVGFAASRMLKASSGDRYRSSPPTQSNGTARVTPGAAVGHGTRASQFEPHA